MSLLKYALDHLRLRDADISSFMQEIKAAQGVLLEVDMSFSQQETGELVALTSDS